MTRYGLQRATFPLILMLLLICAANQGFCSEKGESPGKSPSPKISGSGASADDPIVIKGASGSSEGIRMEYTILARKFPKCSRVSQRLIRHKDRPMDVIRIRLANGTERDVFFDISDFFGKTALPSSSSAECTISEDTSIFRDKSFLQYLADLPEGKDPSSDFQKLAMEGKLKTISKGTKVESLRTEKVKNADIVEIRIPNNANAPGTWWILKTSLTCSH
jgi:hypothetical protein